MMMRVWCLGIVVSMAALATSCRTTSPSGGRSNVKEVESVKKLNYTVGNLPSGLQVAVIKCATGWVDAGSGGQSEFAVPWQEVGSLSFDQVNTRYCTQRAQGGGGNPLPPPPVGGAAVQLGYYTLSSGRGCMQLFLQPKTANGFLRGVVGQCLNTNTQLNFQCGGDGTCKTQDGTHLSVFDGGLIELTSASGTASYQFFGTTAPEKKPGQISQGPNGSEFAWIPADTFTMGSPTTELGRFNDETEHQVTLTKGFEMQTTEVTQAQYQAVMGTNPSRFKDPNKPVEQVFWGDAQAYVQRLNGLNDGYDYRLPTEAQWEYAARAGAPGPYAGPLDAMAWYNQNSRGSTQPVKTKQPNAWGLYDMHCNVFEWTADWNDAYPSGPVTDPTGPGSGSGRVKRGGGWNGSAQGCRSANRSSVSPDYRSDDLGFRLLRIPKP